jgi:hypothetical protein
MSKSNEYTFCFKDGSLVTFSLTLQEFERVKECFISNRSHVVLDEHIFAKDSIWFIKKREEQPTDEQPSAIPEYMEQDVYEFFQKEKLNRGEFIG